MQWQLGIWGTIPAFAFRHRETKENLCRGGRSQDQVVGICIKCLLLLSDFNQNCIMLTHKCEGKGNRPEGPEGGGVEL
jgi:hypothetical protein